MEPLIIIKHRSRHLAQKFSYMKHLRDAAPGHRTALTAGTSAQRRSTTIITAFLCRELPRNASQGPWIYFPTVFHANHLVLCRHHRRCIFYLPIGPSRSLIHSFRKLYSSRAVRSAPTHHITSEVARITGSSHHISEGSGYITWTPIIRPRS